MKPLTDIYEEKRVVLAVESGMSMSNGYIMSPKNTNFMLFWLQEYRDFTSVGSGLNKWGRFSVLNPWALHKQLGDDYVRTFNGDMIRPAWYEHDKMFKGYYDWSDAYNIHLSPRAWWKYKVKRMNARGWFLKKSDLIHQSIRNHERSQEVKELYMIDLRS